MIEVREAPVPVLCWNWFEGESRDEVLVSVETGWNANGTKVSPCTRGVPLVVLLSNGQKIIVRAKK